LISNPKPSTFSYHNPPDKSLKQPQKYQTLLLPEKSLHAACSKNSPLYPINPTFSPRSQQQRTEISLFN
jgi:hypothetical protein